MPTTKRRALVSGSPITGLTDPGRNALLWRLVYTGSTTDGNRKGDPLYWIVAHPSERMLHNQGLTVLAADTFETNFSIPVATIRDRSEMEVNQAAPEKSSATWTITPLNATPVYQIRNFRTGLVLGALSDRLDGRQEDAKFPTSLASYGFALPQLCVTLTDGRKAAATDPGVETGWRCSTFPQHAAARPIRNDQVEPGDVLVPDQPVPSADGRYRLVFQRDGDLVLHGPRGPLWSAGTGGKGRRCRMQPDGNLVIQGSGKQTHWTSGTAEHPGSTLLVQDNGNVVIFAPDGTPLWETRTSQG